MNISLAFIILLVLFAVAVYMLIISRQRLRQLSAVYDHPACLVNVNGRVRQVINKSTAKKSIINSPQINSNILELLPNPAEKAQVKKALHNIAEEKTSRTDLQCELKGSDGNTYTMILSAVRYDDSLILVTIRPIESIHFELMSQPYFEQMLNAIDVPLFTRDMTGIHEWHFWNKALCKLVGTAQGDIKQYYHDVMPALAIKKLDDDAQEIMTGKEPQPIVLEIHNISDNKTFKIEVQQQILQLGKRRIIIGYAYDLTDKEKQQDQRKRISRIATILGGTLNVKTWLYDVSNDSITITDIQDTDSKKKRVLTISQLIDAIKEKDKEIIRADFDEIRKGRISSISISFTLSDSKQSLTPCKLVGSTMRRDIDGRPITAFGIIYDISQVRQKGTDLKEVSETYTNKDSDSLKLLSNLGAVVSQPLNSIIGYAQLLEQIDDPEQQKTYISALQKDSQRLLQEVNLMILIANVKAGVATLIRQPVNINGFLTECCGAAKNANKKPQVSYILELPQKTTTLYVDVRYLQKVMENLLENAAHFTDKGSITIGYQNIVNNKIKIYVKDTGRGIANELKRQIFDNFEIDNRHISQKSGISLSLCKVIIEQFGGSIGVDSEPGKGSTFWFTLPSIY